MRAIGRWIRRIAVLAVGGVAMSALLVAIYVAVVWLRLPSVEALGDSGDPGATAFMRESGCESPSRRWLPLDQIDPQLPCALVWAEDAGFYHHDGVDWQAMQTAAEDNLAERDIVRGGSTIPMQLARNLYLTRARHPSRKLREILLARRLVDRYSRERLLELYVNAVELAPCVYGAEAGARHYFAHTARMLDIAEATFLAAVVSRPNTPPGTARGDRSWFTRKQQRLVRNLNYAGLLPKHEAREAMRAVLALWQAGWQRYRPAPSPSAPRAWYRRRCGAGER